jgi:hypothetical protein
MIICINVNIVQQVIELLIIVRISIIIFKPIYDE